MARSHFTSGRGFTLLEELLHSISHGVGAALSLAGAVILLVMRSYRPPASCC